MEEGNEGALDEKQGEGAMAKLVQMFEGELRRELTPLQRERLMQLGKRVEAGEVSEYRYDLNDVEMRIVDAEEDVERVQPLRRADVLHGTVGMQAVIVFPEELERLEYIKIRMPNGKDTIIGSECLAGDDVLILYPEDLGE